METLAQPVTAPRKIVTLSTLDDEQDFSPIDDQLQSKMPERCESIEFLDDYRDAGKRWLKYNASVQYGTQRGTGSRWESEGKYETVKVQTEVHPEMDIDLIVWLLISDINAEIDALLDC